jgi:hypothetical protein
METTILEAHEPGIDTPAYLRPVGTDQAVLLSPHDAYRQSVFDGIYSQDICEAAAMTKAEWEGHRRWYQRRQDAARGLTERLPVLEQAAAAEQAALGPILTLADSVRQTQAAAARDRVTFTRQAAEEILLTTAATPPANPEADRLRSTILDLERRVHARREILGVERLIAEMRARIDGISTGRISIVDFAEWQARYLAGPPSLREQVVRENGRLLAEAKAELARLLNLVKQRPAAEQANAADQAELARLQRDLEAAESKTREWQLVPENMRWSE